MNSPASHVDPFDLVIFGGTGDLAMRKLLPALLHRYVDGQIPEGTRVIGVAREQLDDDGYRAHAREALGERPQLDAFLKLLHYRPLDARKDDGWQAFAEMLDAEPGHVRVFYLSTSPELFEDICNRLGSHGLNRGQSRVVLEKPIGHDLASASHINDAVGRVFDESQIFRIDHYLGKETVQNLLVLRFGNALFEPLWNAGHIDHVQITVAETLGVGRRGAYYDRSGALRDMVQNHMLQLLCMVAMEPPASLSPDAVRDEKLKVLHALKPIDGRNAMQLTVRGQYRAGVVDGQKVPGYQEDLGGKPSDTETFVALKAEIGNWRWAGVPFYLRTGKRLAQRVSEIVVAFKSVPHSIFDATVPLAQNRLVLRLQPDEGVKLWLTIKHPGPGGLRLRHVPLDMSFAEAFGVQQPDAYERLLLDVVRGNPTLFMRRDEVEAAWRWADPILAAWAASGEAPRPYAAGSWGPTAAVALIERDGRTWNEDSE
ncbi:glucose-6-phosphate dehydrogenase [Aerosticca soli]|uniref:Glucose-6-phosphate 1-dehydrogenase n=1 Tax=Aerosticca soli TaxID=2010829 RepID=A0A2Z6E807_9GAMM|nr:glucose-6-phosphate dehydrogenase [Aerosticca soli]MDI3262873.1 glucose-6-phosphate dehydrogenase [Fulvimonas sp.]BBD81187.1 glucose-6-phosphate 1-dehydrogenase [Aerosticca soli]